MKIKKSLVFVLILTVLLIPLISSQQVVEVSQSNQAEKKNILLAPFEILKSPLVWGIMLFAVLIVIIVVIAFFVVRWLVKFIKLRNDLFYRLRNERMKLAKIHRRYNSKHWFKVEKNTPIRFVKKDGDKLIVTRPIAYHRGDYLTHEGNFVISMNLVGSKHWFVFPKTDLLIIPNKRNIEIEQKNLVGKGKSNIKVILENIPNANEIVQFNEGEILLFAESLSNTGMFFIPVLKSPDGKVIDLAMPIYHTLKQVVLEDYLYEQTSEFGQLAKQSMNINPHVRVAQKLNDTTGNVEIPQDNRR